MLKRILIFLGVLGPSVITTMAGNDGGGVITYSLAGAKFGYSILFVIPFLTVLYAVTQEIGSRIAIVGGKGLGDLIRERFGVRIALFLFVLLSIANFGSVLTNVAALKTSSQLLHVPAYAMVVGAVILSFLLVTFTSYEKSQKIFLTGIIFYGAYVFSAVAGKPHWSEAVTAMFVPRKEIFSLEYLFIAIAVLGTTITPWGQFFVQSYMKDKNTSINKLGFARLEAYLGAFIAEFFAFFIIVATAATLFVRKIPLESGAQAAEAIKPFAGELSGVLFAVGLVSAAIIGMVIVSLTSAYAFTEFFGFVSSLDAPLQRGKIFYGIFLWNLVLSAILVLTPWVSLFKIVLYTQSLNAILLPVFFYFILRLVNDKSLMGKHVNGKWYNYFAVGSTVFIAFAGVAAIVLALLGKV